MKIVEFDLSQQTDTRHFLSARSVLTEFADLEKMYKAIGIIVAHEQQVKDGSVNEVEAKLLEITDNAQIHRLAEIKPAHAINMRDKGCVEIVKELFDNLPTWKKTFVLRHEFCHLLLQPKDSPSLQTLSERYSRDWLHEILSRVREYQVHRYMIERYFDDWIREPVRISETVGSPRNTYRGLRKRKGVKYALSVALSNTTLVLSFVYLTEFLLESKKTPQSIRALFEADLKRYNMNQNSWQLCIQKDTGRYLSARKWLPKECFEDEELFFRRFAEMVKLIDL